MHAAQTHGWYYCNTIINTKIFGIFNETKGKMKIITEKQKKKKIAEKRRIQSCTFRFLFLFYSKLLIKNNLTPNR